MSRIEFVCDRCGKRKGGIYTPTATSGFYIMESWEKYRLGPLEHLVCDECIWKMPEYQQGDYPLIGVPA